MERKWTPSQENAISLHGKNILVSASAGSGKTSALTERIIRSLKNSSDPSNQYEYKTDISKMLIVTFTKAAASELRSKIADALSSALEKDPNNMFLRKQLILLPCAHISTIDSFYMDIVRSNFASLGIPASFRIGDQAELLVLYRDVMDDVIDDLFNSTDNEGIEFAKFADNFTNAGNDASFNEKLLKIHSALTQYPEGIDLLKIFMDDYDLRGRDFFECRSGELIKERLTRMLTDYIAICEKALNDLSWDQKIEKAYSPAFLSDLTFYKALLHAVTNDGYKKTAELISEFSFAALGRAVKPENIALKIKYQTLRNEMKANLKAIFEAFYALPDEIPIYLEKTANICRILHSVLSEYEKRVYDEKKSKCLFDFSDITMFARSLVIGKDGLPTDVARSIRDKFDEIYIDEYQDTNALQDSIFTAIAKENNRFMVGDIKQSIYSFRGAQPDIFASYRKKYPSLSENDPTSASIFMSENFRCDEHVIKFVNTVFSYAFELCKESIDFTKQDNLIFSKKYSDENYTPLPVTFSILESKSETSDNSSSDTDTNEAEIKGEEKEYHYIANEIIKILSATSANGKKYKPNDISILVRTQGQIDRLSAVLKQYSISSVSPTSEDIFRTPEVLLMTSLLGVIDNPTDDTKLAAALCSPVFDFTFDELIYLRKKYGISASLFENLIQFKNEEHEASEAEFVKKCVIVLEWIEKYMTISRSMPIDMLLRVLYRDPLCVFVCGSESVKMFYEYARKYESGSFRGLYNFLRYVESVKDSNISSVGEFVPNEDSVTVMTIHKSKGLEFPVCFIAGLRHNFNFRDLYEDFLFDRSTGIACNISDNTGFAKYKTPLRYGVVTAKRKKCMEEEMRILYVAMTRAKEKLYLTANVSDVMEKLEYYDNLTDISDFDGEFYTSSYFKWIITSISKYLSQNNSSLIALATGVSKCNFLEIELPQHTDTAALISSNEESSIEKAEIILTENNSAENIFKKRFSYVYPKSYAAEIPAKMSVSRLTPDLLDGLDDYDSPIDFGKRKSIDLETDFTFDVYSPKDGEKEPTAAEKGIATHLVFQFCDFENLRKKGTSEELARLVEQKYIPESTVRIVRKNEIEKFAKSDLFKKICTSSTIYREQRFNLIFKAADFTLNPNVRSMLEECNNELLVQGVIDLVFIDKDGKLILCDYKTDRISRDILQSNDAKSQIYDLVKERHGEQLSYYKKAIKELFGKYPDEVHIYLTQLGQSVIIDV